jgi:hypothetical protein
VAVGLAQLQVLELLLMAQMVQTLCLGLLLLQAEVVAGLIQIEQVKLVALEVVLVNLQAALLVLVD